VVVDEDQRYGSFQDGGHKDVTRGDGDSIGLATGHFDLSEFAKPRVQEHDKERLAACRAKSPSQASIYGIGTVTEVATYQGLLGDSLRKPGQSQDAPGTHGAHTSHLAELSFSRVRQAFQATDMLEQPAGRLES